MLNYIKAILRKNTLYQKYFQTKVNDARYKIRDIHRYIRQYSMFLDKEVSGNTVFLVFDPKMKHPGLADRFKIICCVYYIAKENGFDFKIIFEEGFNLGTYLCPNRIDWRASQNDLSYSLRNTRLFSYNGGKKKLPKLCKNVCQYHVYNFIGINIIQRLYSEEPIWNRIWQECYNDLFKPTAFFDSIISENKPHEQYVAAHFRFVNSLEHFEDGYYNELSEKEQERLITKCLEALKTLKLEGDNKLIVFSDSHRFMEIVRNNGYSTIGGGNIGHVGYSHDALHKALLDFYIISQSKKIVRYMGNELYGTMFSYYAALINNTCIETRYI